jgi:hypothetical protein
MNKETQWTPLPDPIIEETRRIREEISAQFDHDVGKLCDHLREIEAQYPDRIWRPPPRQEPPDE